MTAGNYLPLTTTTQQENTTTYHWPPHTKWLLTTSHHYPSLPTTALPTTSKIKKHPKMSLPSHFLLLPTSPHHYPPKFLSNEHSQLPTTTYNYLKSCSEKVSPELKRNTKKPNSCKICTLIRVLWRADFRSVNLYHKTRPCKIMENGSRKRLGSGVLWPGNSR